MDYLAQKVAYLKGLADGLGIDESTKEGKLLLSIVETLEDFSDVIGDLIDDHLDLEEYVNFIDEDLADVEEDIYGDESDYEFDDDEFDFDEYDDDQSLRDGTNWNNEDNYGLEEYLEDEEEKE
ncbi:MAG: hypothetical protein H5T96_02055 [Tissierellales bacterium]|nr:hypothetical protein [Tissierellales bacterium]